MRIAVLGGSFDPVHKGHLQIAKQALKKLLIDDVWFMPTNQSPLKHGQRASFYDRCAMLKRAVHPYRHMHLSRLEQLWSGQSYTIRTIKELQRRYPQHTFCWLIGDDQAMHFAKWKNSDECKKRIPFYVFTRNVEPIPLPSGLHRVVMEPIAVSSSAIRAGKQLYMLPDSVLAYIGKTGLYLAEMMKSYMSEKRYQHCLSVAQLCVGIAQANGLDTRVAWIMGITHDICKEMTKKQVYTWMQHHMPDHLQEAVAIWHGYIGADYVAKRFFIHDKRIVQAIYHHVKGDGKTEYDCILFVSDKLDPMRGYDVQQEIAICKKNIKKGFALVKKQQEAYLKKEGTI